MDFTVELTSLIELLSSQIYREPEVFVRELVLNAHDARRRRRRLDPRHTGGPIVIRCEPGRWIEFEDDGIGMSREQLTRSLSRACASETRASDDDACFGRFGVGFFSVLAVAHAVELHTRSARPDAEALRWRWRGGTAFEIDAGDRRTAGTRVRVHCKPEFAHLAAADVLQRLVRTQLPRLDVALDVAGGGDPRAVALREWRALLRDRDDRAAAPLLEETGLKTTAAFVACAPDDAIAVLGVPEPNSADYGRVSVYLRGVLVASGAPELLPEGLRWLCGVLELRRCELTADRRRVERSEEHAALSAAIEAALADALASWAVRDPNLLSRVLAAHRTRLIPALRASAPLRRSARAWFPLHTTRGPLTFAEIVATCPRTGGIGEVCYQMSAPQSDMRWSVARTGSRLVVHAPDNDVVELLWSLARDEPALTLRELYWGGPVRDIQVPLPDLGGTATARLAALRAYFSDRHVLVEPGVYDPPTLPCVVEITSSSGSTGGGGGWGGLLRSIDRIFGDFVDAGAQSSARLHLNLANRTITTLLTASAEPAIPAVAAALFAAGLAEASREPSRAPGIERILADLLAGALAPSPARSSTAAHRHVLCFFAFSYRRQVYRDLLTALRDVLEDHPYCWEVRSAEEDQVRPDLYASVWEQIAACDVLLADVTEHNPNVTLEVGLALGMEGRAVELLAQQGYQPIADLQGRLIHLYDPAALAREPSAVRDALRRWITASAGLRGIRRAAPYLGYRLLTRAKIFSPRQEAAFAGVWPDPRSLLSESIEELSSRTHTPPATVAAAVAFFREREHRHNSAT